MRLDTGNRFWRFFAAGSIVAFVFLLSFGTELSRKGIEQVLRLVATSQLEDWAVHISEKHGDIIRHLHTRPISPDLVADLRREAEMYGVSTFTIRRVEEKLGKYRLYAHNTGISRAEVVAIERNDSQQLEAVRIRIPLLDSRGVPVAEIDAIVNQKRLYAQLLASMQKLLLATVLAIVFVIALAWVVMRNMMRDSRLRLKEAQKIDALTGLPNQQAFNDHAQLMMELQQEAGEKLVCLIFAVDNLGRITCSEGHEVAGHALRTLASRFARIAHEHDARAFRLDRDDFAMLVPASEENVRDLVPHLVTSLRREAQRSIYWRGKALQLTLSIGISVFPNHAASSQELARQASLMRQSVREAGGDDFRIYEAGMDREYHEKIQLERLVRRAARNCAAWFELAFQPIVHLETETLHGFEALLRLRDADGNYVSPAVFVPIAEQLNLMDDIGAFVLSESCRIAAQWPDHLHVSVNLSPQQFQSGKLVSKVWQALETSGLAPHRLELEVTESLMMDTTRDALQQLEQLRRREVKIVLDDFGTGYSSMSYLWQFSFDKIKIDRSFTSAISHCHEARSILRALIVMARSLKLPVVVEGIETAEQAAYLRKMRCNFGQGYFFGKPMSDTDLAGAVMEDWRQRKALAQLRELHPPTSGAATG